MKPTSRPHPQASDLFAPFRADHRRVLARLDELEASVLGPGSRRTSEKLLRETLEMLERQFATHMAAEEGVLFPALDDAFPEARGTLGPLRLEHDDLREMLAALLKTLVRPGGREREEAIAVQVRDLVELLRIHVRKEERALFDLAERVLRSRDVRELARRLKTCLPPQSQGVRHGRRKGTQSS